MAREFVLLLAGAVTLAGCAPKPAPVTTEPVYLDKYGQPIIEGCRPAGQLVGAQYPASVRDCPQTCPPGSQLASATAARPAVCVPIPQSEGGGHNIPPVREPVVPIDTPTDNPTGAAPTAN